MVAVGRGGGYLKDSSRQEAETLLNGQPSKGCVVQGYFLLEVEDVIRLNVLCEFIGEIFLRDYRT